MVSIDELMSKAALFHKENNNKQANPNKPLVPDTLVIKMTTNCNLNCNYCYMGNPCNNDTISENLLLNIIEQTDRTLNKPITVYLHGGEPFLAIDLIESIGEKIFKKYFRNKIFLRTQTNGTIISDRIIKAIKKYSLSVGISIDGPNNNSNGYRCYKNGKNPINDIINTMKILKQENIAFGLLSVINNKNVNDQYELFKLAVEFGVKEMVLNPLFLWGKAYNMTDYCASHKNITHMYKKIIECLISYNKDKNIKNRMSERNIRWLTKGLFTKTKGYMCSQSPCGAGLKTITICTDGNIYLCDQYYGDPDFFLGNILDKPLVEIIKNNSVIENNSKRTVNNIKKCSQCNWKFACSGGCRGITYYYYGDLFRESPLCEVYQEIIPFIHKKIKSENYTPDILGA